MHTCSLAVSVAGLQFPVTFVFNGHVYNGYGGRKCRVVLSIFVFYLFSFLYSHSRMRTAQLQLTGLPCKSKNPVFIILNMCTVLAVSLTQVSRAGVFCPSFDGSDADCPARRARYSAITKYVIQNADFFLKQAHKYLHFILQARPIILEQ